MQLRRVSFTIVFIAFFNICRPLYYIIYIYISLFITLYPIRYILYSTLNNIDISWKAQLLVLF